MSIKITVGANVKKQHKKMERFCSGFRNLNHFYSCRFQDKYDNVLATYPSAKSSDFVSAEVELFSSTYSKDKFSRDTIRLFNDIERFVFVNLRVTPIGYDATFNDANKSVKVVFYFLNFNRMDESYRLTSLTNDQLTDIENKVAARIGSAKTLSFSPMEQQSINADKKDDVTVSFTDEMASSVSELITLMGEPDYRMAMQRALRGLDKKQAQKLLGVMNDIVSLSGDQSVDFLEMPKKHMKGKQQSVNVSEDMFDCLAE